MLTFKNTRNERIGKKEKKELVEELITSIKKFI